MVLERRALTVAVGSVVAVAGLCSVYPAFVAPRVPRRAEELTDVATRKDRETTDSQDGWFVPPQKLSERQLIFIGVIYLYILYRGAEFTGSGAELLLLVPATSGIVGSIIIPLSGSTPEGTMVIFSGLGDRDSVRERVKVGIGTIAGSTIFLLTLPWFIAVVRGRVNVIDGQPEYHPDFRGARSQLSCNTSGVGITDRVQRSARSLLGGTILYCMVQIPSFWIELTTDVKEYDDAAYQDELARAEAPFILAASIAGFCSFVAYLYRMTALQHKSNKEEATARREREGDGKTAQQKPTVLGAASSPSSPVSPQREASFPESQLDEECSLIPHTTHLDEMESVDGDEIPSDLSHLKPTEQQRRIVLRAVWMMATGLSLTFVFTDPLVDVLAEVGLRLGVSPFYVSFIVAPLTSNATELYTTYIFASKRTSKAVEASLSTLLGSSVLDSTFVFPLFLVIIYCRGLPWTFAAETMSILFTIWILTGLTLWKQVHRCTDAVLILLLHPVALFIVWLLTHKLGLD